MTKAVSFPGLPVEETFDALKQALREQTIAILEAPPGAGKTTLVPLALLDAPWLKGQKIILLEPRRLAARTAAQRMASLLGETVGETVGYRIRQDRKVGPQTRIEVVTEGILTRQLQNDPELLGVGLVIFDEFHERNLQGDLGLAFCLESQEALRNDLRLLVMSATLEGQELDRRLNGAPHIVSEGRSHPVELRHLARPDSYNLPGDIARAVQKAVREESGNILVFLPGEGEIRRTQSLLADQYAGTTDILIYPLYGALKPQDQDLAIAPPQPGKRKIVLATTIAETSLTIEGVRVVIDCGLKRVSRFDSTSAMTRLETVRVSRSSADQRTGRAGRLEPGICYRLWPEAETQALPARDRPEILDCDLAPLALELAHWGVSDIHDLRLMDYPGLTQMTAARDLLIQIGALDKNDHLTPHGKEMMALSLHPRFAHMILQARKEHDEHAALACFIAALLQDGPVLKGKREADIRHSLSLLVENKPGNDVAKGPFYRAKQTAKDLMRRLRIQASSVDTPANAGSLLALAFPDRIAKQRQKGQPVYHLSSGKGAALRDDDPLLGEAYLVCAEIGGRQNQPVIFSAAPISLTEIEDKFTEQIVESNEVGWDNGAQAATAKRVRKMGALTLSSRPIHDIDPELMQLALCTGIRKNGLHVLPWTQESKALCQRIMTLRENEDWPDMGEEALLETLEQWLKPYLVAMNRLDHLKKLNLEEALLSLLDWNQQQELNRLAPTHYRVPSGSSIRLDYGTPKKPVLAVKLQEMFGQPQTPTINNGKIRLQIHLLSPAGRPLQVTEDLESFWKNAYDSVKKEMRGRYPKHPWPDNPLEAIATRKTKRHL